MGRLRTIWIVTAPRRHSAIGDIVCEVSPEQLINQIKGGLSTDDEPLFFDNLKDAEAEGTRRLNAYKQYRAVLDGRTDTR